MTQLLYGAESPSTFAAARTRACAGSGPDPCSGTLHSLILNRQARNVAEAIRKHVTLEVECIDRLNLCQPRLQTPGRAAWFFRGVRGNPVPSSALMAPMTRDFVAAIERFAREGGLDLVRFRKGERKDERTQQYLRQWPGGEGVLYIGKAREQERVLRTQASTDPATGLRSTRLVSSTAMPNAYYFYVVDEDFGPLFVKFCSCLTLQRQALPQRARVRQAPAAREGIGFEALDNGLLSCADPQRLQAICRQLTAARIDELARRWLARLPHPFTAQDRRAGMLYQVSVLQAEFSLTQVFDRPLQGRVFFEEVIRENLDLGRPDHVQLVFGRRVTRRPRASAPG